MPTKILLADDSMTAQKMGKEILTTAGYEVTAVSNGAAAAKKIADKFDVIILDINMPGYTGLEVCEKIRANMEIAKTPVLLTIGKMEHYEPADTQRVKADGVIIKPFEATDLLAIVKKLAEKAAAAAAPPKPDKPEYEKTMVFTASQVQEFKDQSYAEWKTDAPNVDATEAPADPPPSAAFEMSHAEASAPAFAMDMSPSPSSFDETVGFAPVAASPAMDFGTAAAPAFDMSASPAFATESASGFDMPATPSTSGFDLTPTESNSIEALLEPTAPAFDTAPPLPIQNESALEPTVMPTVHVAASADPYLETPPAEEAKEYSIPAQDPALAQHVELASAEFVTRIGTSEAEPTVEAQVEVEAEAPSSPTAADDDFEARVAAAMSGFETPAPETLEVAEVIEPEPEPAVVAESNIIIEAIHTEAKSAEPPAYEKTQKLDAVPDPEPAEVIPDPVAEAMVEVEPVTESQAPPEGMHDAELVEQMHAAFADLPVETEPHVIEEPIPAEEPVPAFAASNPVPEVPASGGPDMDLASALAAAVGGEPSAAVMAAAAASHGGLGLDHAALTSVVSRVMERMIPVVMMEIAKEMEANKNK